MSSGYTLIIKDKEFNKNGADTKFILNSMSFGSYFLGSNAGGRTSGRPTVDRVTVTFATDGVTPRLVEYHVTGKHIAQVLIVVESTGGQPIETIELTNVIINGLQSGGDRSQGVQTMTLAFEKIEIKVDASGNAVKTAGIPTKAMATGVK
jgi:type VI protein secretion system component Hcp